MNSIIDDIKMQYKIGGVSFRLIFWNISFFIISIVFFYNFKLGIFEFPIWIALQSAPYSCLIHPWTLISYAFFHYSFGHLFFNLMVLHFSSRLFLTFFNPNQYLGLYVLSAIFSGFVFVIGYYFLNLNSAMVGASGAIMAILVATTTYRPLMNIRLALLGNVNLWHITAVILLLDFLQFKIENTGGHLAHLGGAFFGFLYIKLLQNGRDLSLLVSWIWTQNFSLKKKTPFKKVHKNYNKNYNKTTNFASSKIVIKDKQQQQIDEILDKISQSGYDSLSKEEKEFLFKAGK